MDVSLVLFKKNGSQKSFSLPSNITVLGRRGDCDLCIPLGDVSRRHCQLDRNNETLQIRDLGSRNGTFLNGEQVNGETTVKAGDYLQIGPLTFQFQIDGEPQKTTPPQDHLPKAEEKQLAHTAADDDDLLDLDIDEDVNVDLDDSGAFLDDLDLEKL
ncbi:MAG: FHA domain-containing protein [Sedimentisphaerales bacterium]|nr:FHA domain-containing protein [Sedimentisphaerales bacterium]